MVYTIQRLTKYLTYHYHLLSFIKIRNINAYEKKYYSQNGEDGIIKFIFKKVGTTNKYYVEIGSGNGEENNTRYLKSLGWQGVQIDTINFPGINKHFITAENVENIFKKYQVPDTIDLLSIDVDGNDYWIWKAIKHYYPRLVVIEYNASLPLGKSLVIPYKQHFAWDGSSFYGASLRALTKLAKGKGYQLIGTNSNGVNAFFIRDDLAKKHFIKSTLSDLYHSPAYCLQKNGTYSGHPKSSKMFQMIKV